MIEKKNFYINGKWVSPVKPNDFDVIDPSTEEAFAVISLGSIEDTDKAVSAAKVAFETWRETSKEERVKLLEKFCEIYNRRWDEMVEAQSMEMGAPLDFASDIHTKMGADISRNTIDILKSFNFDFSDMELPADQIFKSMKSDKKNTNTINLVLLKDIGSPYILEETNEERLVNFIKHFIENFEK